MSRFALLLVLLAFASWTLAQDAIPCRGTQTYDLPTGTVADHTFGTPSTHYGNGASCIFIITVTRATTITLEFTKFDLEFDYDFLTVYEGYTPDLNPSNEVAVLTGQNPLEAEKNRLVILGSAVTLHFATDPYVTATGFSLNYYGASCTDNCNDRGVCTADNMCECDEGYSGTACEISSQPGDCPNACSYPNGECTEVVQDEWECVCRDGYHGADCSDPFCQPLTLLTTSSGAIRDRVPGLPAANSMTTCTWTIQPKVPADTIILNIVDYEVGYYDSSGDAEDTIPYLRMYDGPNASFPLIADLSGFYRAPQILAHSGVMTIEFYTGSVESGNQPKLSAKFASVTCAGQCSGHGACVGSNECHCDDGWGGATCSATACTHNCNPGTGTSPTGNTCVANECVCSPSWTGPACGTCVPGGPTACPASCAPSTVLTTSAGTITSSYANYERSDSCRWVINPTASHSSISLTFQEFELIEGHAYVSVYALDPLTNNEHLVGEFTGSDTPEGVFVTGSEELVVVFTSDDFATTGAGFVASYAALTCPGDCSGHGQCIGSGRCICDLGYSGSDCGSTVCVGDCNAGRSGGQCNTITNVCECNTGYFGVDCREQFCGGTTFINSDSAVISERSTGNQYLPYMYCEWFIETSGTSDILILMQEQQFEPSYDGIIFFTYEESDDDWQALTATTNSQPIFPLIIPAVDQFAFTFSSDATIEFHGFTMKYYRQGACQNACSGSGLCIDGACRCYGGAGGLSCENSGAAIMPSLDANADPGVVFSDTFNLAQYQWLYYEHTINEGQTLAYDLDIAIETKMQGDIHAHFFIARNRIPYVLFGDFDFEWDSFSTLDENFLGTYYSLSIGAAVSGTYYIGVYGYKECLDCTLHVTRKTAEVVNSGIIDDTQNKLPQPSLIAIGITIMLILVGAATAAFCWLQRRQTRYHQALMAQQARAREQEEPMMGGGEGRRRKRGQLESDDESLEDEVDRTPEALAARQKAKEAAKAARKAARKEEKAKAKSTAGGASGSAGGSGSGTSGPVASNAVAPASIASPSVNGGASGTPASATTATFNSSSVSTNRPSSALASPFANGAVTGGPVISSADVVLTGRGMGGQRVGSELTSSEDDLRIR